MYEYIDLFCLMFWLFAFANVLFVFLNQEGYWYAADYWRMDFEEKVYQLMDKHYAELVKETEDETII